MHVFRTDYFLLIAAIASIWICLSAALLTSRTLQNVARHRADPQSPVARHVLRSVSILDQQYEASNAQVSVSEQKFFLTELIDDEVLESVVVMKSNGEIAFLKMEGYGSEGNAVSNSITSIRGSWKYYKKDGTLQMMIERTMMGRLSEYRVRSRYISTRQEQRNGIVSYGGDVFEDDYRSDDPHSSLIGQFMATTVSAREKAERGASSWSSSFASI